MTFIHEKAVNTKLFKGYNIVFFTLVIQSLHSCFQRFSCLFHLLDGVVFGVLVFRFFDLLHQLVKLFLQHPLLTFYRQRDALKLAVSDHHRIIISRCDSRTELFTVGRLKILFRCYKDIGAGIEL